MFHNLRLHFTKLYVYTTGAFFFLVLLGIFLLFSIQMNETAKEELLTQMNLIKNHISDNSSISDQWLSKLERKNQLVIAIEDNGTPFLYNGTMQTATSRDFLIKQVKTSANEHGIFFDSYPLSFEQMDTLSPVPISGEHGEKFYGSACLIVHSNSWQSIIVLKNITKLQHQKYLFFFLLLVIGLIGIFLFSWISYKITGKMLYPLEENYQKQTDFIAAASHELKSPLAVIRTSISEAKQLLNEEPKERDLTDSNNIKQSLLSPLSIMDSETVRMARLIDDLLLLSSSNTHTWSLSHETIDTDSLLIDTFDHFESLFEKNNRSLLLSLPEEPLPLLIGDRIRCSQILAILLDNALTYTPEGSTVVLSGALSAMAYAPKSFSKFSCGKNPSLPALVLSVSDNGLGIPKEKQSAIFDRFYQADPSHTKKEHFGLGLSIAKELTELHGGQIRYRDSSTGGACFECYFPLSNETFNKTNSF